MVSSIPTAKEEVLALVPPGSTPRNQQEEKDIMRLLRDETSWGRTLTVGRHDGPLIDVKALFATDEYD
ncbi:unnamed protein product [Boreogadus saida]